MAKGSSHDWFQFPWLTLLGSAAAAGIFMVPRFADALAYSTQAPHSWWQAITCHWVHWNGEHLGWSVLAFMLAGALCERQNRTLFAACVIASALAVPLALRGMAANVPSYAGLSGIDFALYTLYCTALLRQTANRRDWLPCALAGLLLAAAFGKIAYELATGAVLFVSDTSALAPVPQAHLVAAIIGVALGIAPGKARSGGSVAGAVYAKLRGCGRRRARGGNRPSMPRESDESREGAHDHKRTETRAGNHSAEPFPEGVPP